MDEIEKLKGFVKTTLEFVGLSSYDPKLAQTLDKAPIQGVRIAAQDAAQLYEDLSSNKTAELDALLSSKGLPTLTQMHNKSYRQFLSVLSKQVIKSDKEFRLLNAFVSEQSSTLVSQQEVDIANKLMANYETSK